MTLPAINRFLTHVELEEALRQLIAAAPEALTLHAIGKTPEGRALFCVAAAANTVVLPVGHRPALLVTGHAHSVEYAGMCQALHLLRHLAQNYGRDAAVTRLLDEQTIYVIPTIAADGGDFTLATRHRVRSRRIDVREPNVIQPRDLDGDGRVMTMRWRCDTGRFSLRESDPRLVVARQPADAGPFYETAIEGLIDEWDGGEIKPSDARCDFNRNYPTMNWAPFHDWIGHGPYPLSEPETRAVADFVLQHPQITGVADFHTGNPAVFYPTATLKEPFSEDGPLIQQIAKRAESLTGFPVLAGYDEAKSGIKVNDCPGSFRDWVYERTGTPVFILEMGMFYNYCGLSTKDIALSTAEHERRWGLALLQWHDQHPDRGLFTDWRPFEHPQLGPVEIGGWDWVPWSNPPLEEMDAVCDRGTRFLLEFAGYRPHVQVRLQTQRLGDDLHKITARLLNTGPVSTSITRHGERTHPHGQPQVRLESSAIASLIVGRPRQTIDHLAPLRGSAELLWIIKAPSPTPITVTVSSPRGLWARQTVEL